MRRALFIFRRDLRLEDNRALLSAMKFADETILCFIFTPEQIENNPYRSERCLQFMIESLEDLEHEIKERKGVLHLFYDKPERVVEQCIEKLNIVGVFLNQDYTPYSIQRDEKIKAVCDRHAVHFQAEHDLLLHPIEETLKTDKTPYTVFTPFYRRLSALDVASPQKSYSGIFYSKPIPFSAEKSLYKKILKNRLEQAPGGRKEALKILKNLALFSDYPSERNIPALDKTTHLSAHLKFTTCSVREIYRAIVDSLGPASELIRSLYWRDFFTLTAFHFPHVFQGSFKTKFENIHWMNDQKLFQSWCEGMTGFPLIDAGMRELNITGFMHNRVRMVTASFLVKDLHVNWQWGERYFARCLIDYDPAVNNGNWQWSAGTGCDAQPYFRIFNPWAQAKKFDPDCLYIKKWVPELASLPSDAIHTWHLNRWEGGLIDYPRPIIDHTVEAKVSIKAFKTT